MLACAETCGGHYTTPKASLPRKRKLLVPHPQRGLVAAPFLSTAYWWRRGMRSRRSEYRLLRNWHFTGRPLRAARRNGHRGRLGVTRTQIVSRAVNSQVKQSCCRPVQRNGTRASQESIRTSANRIPAIGGLPLRPGVGAKAVLSVLSPCISSGQQSRV